MLSQIITASLYGLDSEIVTVETDLTYGLPAMSLVGLPDLTIRESKERVKSAIVNSGYAFPMKRITVNLSPANTRKTGSHFDLPIALGIYSSANDLKVDLKLGIIGELSLNGSVNKVSGALPLVMGLKEAGIKKVIIPSGNLVEVSLIKGLDIYPVSNLNEAINVLLSKVDKKNYYPQVLSRLKEEDSDLDYAQVLGQERSKRAFEISAAGAHGIVMVGPPGVGKTMMARRIPTILPPLNHDEILETTKIFSVAGKLNINNLYISKRPFRAPHHSITPAAMLGGGNVPRPGEISLAHNGVLFLDEAPEFKKYILDMLREPIEEKIITLARDQNIVTFPTDFILILAMNPCPCGYYNDPVRECKCSDYQIMSYMKKVSIPLLDRVDIHINVTDIKGISQGYKTENSKSSGEMRESVLKARKIQMDRFKDKLNSALSTSEINKYCIFEKSAIQVLEEAYGKYKLNMRSVEKIKKISRTIADLNGHNYIKDTDLAEALSYRVSESMHG